MYFILSMIIMALMMHVYNQLYIHNNKVDAYLFIVFSISFAPVILPIIIICGTIFKLSSKRTQVKLRNIMYDVGNPYDNYDLFLYLELIPKTRFYVINSIRTIYLNLEYKWKCMTARYAIEISLYNCTKETIKPEYDCIRLEKCPNNGYVKFIISGFNKKTKEVYLGREDSVCGRYFFKFNAKRAAKKLKQWYDVDNIAIDWHNKWCYVDVKVIVL